MFDKLKRLFPKPHIPQKRYCLIVGLILWAVCKLYVIYTPGHEDDKWPDKMGGLVIEYFADNQDSPSEMYGANGMRYGERD